MDCNESKAVIEAMSSFINHMKELEYLWFIIIGQLPFLCRGKAD